MAKRSRHVFGPVLLGILFILSLGYQSKPSVIANDSPILLTQDVGELKNTNGKIVAQKLLKINSSLKDGTDCYKIEYLSDGLRVVGFVVKPKQVESKLPVLLFNRGGGGGFGMITEENLNYFSFLASKGYVLLASQYRGNDGGEGREEFGGKDVDDVLNLIPLAKSLPFADQNRIGMLGFSRGGMMTYIAIKRGIPIRAAAVVGGLSDLLEFDLEKGKDRMKYNIKEVVGPDIEEYKQRSACYWPERIDVPVLILHGESDQVVNVRQAKELGEKLGKLGKTYQLVIFPRGDHGLNNVHNQRDKTILEWFEKYLKRE